MENIKSEKFALHGAANSMQGGRQENQDAWGYTETPLGCLVIICDGMGGGPAGKTASYIVKNEIALSLCEEGTNVSRDYAFKVAVARAHAALENQMEMNPSMTGMGSTFVAALISKQSVVIAHAGDSRFYKLRGKECIFRSNDHSLVAELVRKKVMTEEQARISPQSNVITRGLGSTSNHTPEIDEIPYRKGDRFVLCTDGVWGIMPHKDLLKRFTQKTDPSLIVNSLSAEVDQIGFAKGGGHDNHTIAIIDINDSSEMKEKIDSKKIAIISGIVALCISLIAFVMFLIFGQSSNGVISSSLVSGEGSGYSSSYSSSVAQDTTVTTEKETTRTGLGLSKEVANVKDALQKKMAKKDSVDSIAKKTKAEKEVEEKDSKKVQYSKESNRVLAQKLENRFKEAQNVKEKKLEDAKARMTKLQEDAKSIIKQLSDSNPNAELKATIDAISRFISSNDKIWYIASEKNKDGFYIPTRFASDNLKKMEEKAKDLKTQFSK